MKAILKRFSKNLLLGVCVLSASVGLIAAILLFLMTATLLVEKGMSYMGDPILGSILGTGVFCLVGIIIWSLIAAIFPQNQTPLSPYENASFILNQAVKKSQMKESLSNQVDLLKK